MKIIIHARSFFEARMGTRIEAELFRDYRIISINDVTHHPEPPPFSERFYSAPNLLTLFFDDVEQDCPAAFSPEQAEEIIVFMAKRDDRPLLIHCMAGVSRSGAIGIVIAKHSNCIEEFIRGNPDIQPNEFVVKRLERGLQGHILQGLE